MYSNTVPQLVEYTTLTEKDISDEEIILNIQGSAVELHDVYEESRMMHLFHLIHRYGTECVLRTNNKRYLIFSHHVSPVLRDVDILLTFSNSAHFLKTEENPHIIIYMTQEWEMTSGTFEKRVNHYVRLLQEILVKSEVTLLIGVVPPLILLLTQHACYGFSNKLYYQKTLNSTSVTIF